MPIQYQHAAVLGVVVVAWLALQKDTTTHRTILSKTNDCTIDRLTSLSRADFVSKYVSTGRPFLLQLHPSLPFFENGSSFLESAALWLSGVYDNEDGVAEALQAIQSAEQQFDQERRSAACVITPWHNETGDSLRQTYQVPQFLAEDDILASMDSFLRSIKSEFGYPSAYAIIGPSRSGARFHADYFQTSFWNLALAGAKRWILTRRPPVWAQHKWTLQSHDRWFAEEYPRLAESGVVYDECTQRRGELLWAPGGTFHATYNLMPTASISQNIINDWNVKEALGDAGAVCYEQHPDRPRDFMRSLYCCLALSMTSPDIFRSSCCSSQRFSTHLDGFPAFVRRGTDQLANSQLYKKLLVSVRTVGDR